MIRCNRKGGYTFRTMKLGPGGRKTFAPLVRLKYGNNDVTAEAWAEVARSSDPKWLNEVTSPGPRGGLPLIELEFKMNWAPDEPQKLTAAETIELIKACPSIEELEPLLAGEDRKTVLEAGEKRWDELSGS